MTTEFEDRFAASAWPILVAPLGRTVTHTPDGGSGTAYTATVGRERTEPSEDMGGTILRRICTVTFAAADVSNPGVDDTITIGSEVWEIESVSHKDGAVVECECVRIEAAERSRPGYRGRR